MQGEGAVRDPSLQKCHVSSQLKEEENLGQEKFMCVCVWGGLLHYSQGNKRNNSNNNNDDTSNR